MKGWTKLLTLAVVAAAVPVASMARADEHEHETPVALDKIPAAARDTIVKQAGKEPIIDVVQEHEHGQLVYEAHVRRNGKVIGIEVDANGKFLRNEVEDHEQHEHGPNE